MGADRHELERMLSTRATRECIRAENKRLLEHMTVLMERQGRKMQGLIDAIELMKCIDAEARQHGTAPDD